MTSPSFVNKGTEADLLSGFGEGTSSSVTLPASRTNGNKLFAFIVVLIGGQTIDVGNPGWVIGDRFSNANVSAAWAWREIDGSEGVPFFSWTDSAFSVAQVYQYQDVPDDFIGSFFFNHATGTDLNVSFISTTADASKVIGFAFCDSSETLVENDSFTAQDSQSHANCSYILEDETIASSGSNSDSIAQTIASAHYGGFLIEVLAPGGGGGGGGSLGGGGGVCNLI